MKEKKGELRSAPTDPQLGTTIDMNKSTTNSSKIQGVVSSKGNNTSTQPTPDPVDVVLQWISNSPKNVIMKQWTDKVELLDDTDRTIVMVAVKGKTKANITLLKQLLNTSIKNWNSAAAKSKNQQISSVRKKKKIVEIEYAPTDTRGVTLKAALAIVNDKTPKRDKVFRYGNTLVSIQVCRPTSVRGINQLNCKNINYPNTLVVVKYERITMTHRLEQSAVYIVKGNDSADTLKQWGNDIIDGIFSQTEVNFPTLTGIIQHPFVGLDGVIVTAQGYDPSTGLYVRYDKNLSANLTLKPTKKDINSALKALTDKVFADFPFVEYIDAIASVAAMLTAIQRTMINDDSGCPGFLFDAPTQSTGKTTIAQIISYSVFGKPVAASSWSGNDVEMAKLLLAVLLEGHGCILFDNLPVGTSLESNELAKAMTGNSYSGRILGQNKTATVPTNAIWIFTGNNISICGDFNTRVIPIRLDSRLADPDRRSFARSDIGKWCLENRADIIKACLILMMADCSQLSSDVKPSRYPDWDKYVRLPLLAASGIDVADKFQQNKQADPEIEIRLNFLDAMFREYGGRTVTASDMVNAAGSLRVCINEIFSTDIPSAQQLGKWLGGLKGQVLGGYRITSSKGTNGDAKNRTIWTVEKVKQ